MTVAAMSYAPDRVTVIADTLAAKLDEDGTPRPFNFASKTQLWPHLYAVAVARGSRAIPLCVGTIVGKTWCPNGIADALPAITAGLDELGAHGELLVGGWCKWSSRFRAWHLRADQGWQPRELAAGVYPLPGHDLVDAAGPPLDDDRMAELGQLLVRSTLRGAEEAGDAPNMSGGELVLTRLDRSGFAIRKVARCENFDAVRQMIEDHHG